MIKIMADSTCDLREEIIQKFDIGIVPLTINIDGKEYKEMADLSSNEFFTMLKNTKTHPSTSMPNPGEYLKVFNQAIKDGYSEILCICMSSGSSGSYQSGLIAREHFYEENPKSPVKIHMLDSKCMSHGSGYLVLKSALLREEGFNFQELIEFNETYKTSVKHLLSVDDLDNIARSGRLNNAAAFIGKILKIRPLMSIKDGEGVVVAKERSSKKILSYYISEFKTRVNKSLTDFIIIGYSSDRNKAELLQEKLYKETDFTGEIYIMQMGLTVCNHVGLGGLSMFFMEER